MKLRARGFTLLEVLVAVAVFAVLSSLAYAGLTRMLEGRDRIDAEREKWRTLTLAFAQLEDDLAQARPRGVRGADGNAVPAFRGQPVDPRPLGEPSIEFTRGGLFISGDGATSDLQRVAYRLKDDALVRVVWSSLDRAPGTEPREVKLLTGIDNLTTRFHAPNGAWSDTWPPLSGSNAPLPDAVDLAFDVKGLGRLTRILLVHQ